MTQPNLNTIITGEPIVMAVKPIEGTYAQNALKWGVAGINVDGARIHRDRASPEKVTKCYRFF